MKEFSERGSMLYSSSGDFYRLIGVLRAADMFWNEEKK
jgi:hypothetical protein